MRTGGRTRAHEHGARAAERRLSRVQRRTRRSSPRARLASRLMAPSGTQGTPPPGGLRVRTARGGAVNAAFLSGAEALVLLQGLLAIALLGPGPDRPLRRRDDHRDDDRRAAPGRDRRGVRADDGAGRGGRVPARAHGRAGARACWARSPSPRWRRCSPRPTTTTGCWRLTLAVSYLPVAFALQAPQWVFFKRMEYVRLRSLQAIVPLGTVAVVVPLLLLGVGGVGAGDRAVRGQRGRRSSPPGAPRPTRCGCGPTARPRAATCASRGPSSSPRRSRCSCSQGQIAVFGISDGLAAAGWITLAATLTRYADRADQIVATTIYPAIVRVRDRVDVLEELFAKANRLTLMWAFPFGAGPRAVRRRPDRLRARRRVARERSCCSAGWRSRSRCSRSATAGSRSTGRAASRGRRRSSRPCSASRSPPFAIPGALLGGSWGFVVGRMGCTVCVLAVRQRLRAPAAARRADGRARAASRGAGRARLGARARRCGGAVGRRADARAGADRARVVARRCSRSRRSGFESDLLAELRGYLRRTGAPA